MTIQQALIEYPYISGRVRELNREINEILSIKYDTSITAKITGMPSGGQISNPTLQAVEQICDYMDVRIEQLGKRITALWDTKEMVDSRLDRLNIQERRVIEHRYFNGMNWPEIFVAMRYSRSQVFEIHSRALDKMESKEWTKPDYTGLQIQMTL